MKKDNKGFMLVEVIVTSTIIVTSMIALYTSFNKIYRNYETRVSYQNLDALYATKEMIHHTLIKGNVNDFLNEVFYNSDYRYLIEKGVCESEVLVCNELKDLYQIENMIIVAYDKKVLEDIKEKKVDNNYVVTNQTFKEYIDYVIKYYDIASSENDYSYIFLTETKVGEEYNYASLRVR